MSKPRISKQTSAEVMATKAVARLSSELDQASAALRPISADVPSGQQLYQLVEKFRRELDDVVAQSAARKQPEVAPTATRSLPQLTTYVLERINGGVAKTLIVQE